MTMKDFSYWWNVPGEWVEPPNQRRSGWSGMMRASVDGRLRYVKRQLNHVCRTLSHPLGWPTASREWYYLKRLRGLGINVPVPVFHAARQSSEGVEAVLVTEELRGFVALSECADFDAERKTVLANRVGDMLGRLHRARLQHSSLYDKHVMVLETDGDFDVALIDLEKMRPRLFARHASSRDLEQLQRRQQVFDDVQWRVLLAAHDAGFRADV